VSFLPLVLETPVPHRLTPESPPRETAPLRVHDSLKTNGMNTA